MNNFTLTSALRHLVGSLYSGPAICVTLLVLLPVASTAVVLTWHGLRGTDPGPAAEYLLRLVALVLPAPRRRSRRDRGGQRRREPSPSVPPSRTPARLGGAVRRSQDPNPRQAEHSNERRNGR
jgi:hypothetical protein